MEQLSKSEFKQKHRRRKFVIAEILKKIEGMKRFNLKYKHNELAGQQFERIFFDFTLAGAIKQFNEEKMYKDCEIIDYSIE